MKIVYKGSCEPKLFQELLNFFNNDSVYPKRLSEIKKKAVLFSETVSDSDKNILIHFSGTQLYLDVSTIEIHDEIVSENEKESFLLYFHSFVKYLWGIFVHGSIEMYEVWVNEERGKFGESVRLVNPPLEADKNIPITPDYNNGLIEYHKLHT